MATSKTLAPTNVTISIPAMTDQPDASVFSNCVDKEADAINALNSQLGGSKIYRISKTVTIPAGNTTTPGELEVDFSSEIGDSSIWATMCTLNSNVLPYVSNTGAVKTWVRLLSGSPTKKIIIYNTDTAWTNYTLYAVLICT